MEEFDEKMSEIISYIPTHSHSKDGESLLRYVNVQNETGLKVMKLFFLSQLKTIELLKEEIGKMRKKYPKGNPAKFNDAEESVSIWAGGNNNAIDQAITLLYTIIQEVKSKK